MVQLAGKVPTSPIPPTDAALQEGHRSTGTIWTETIFKNLSTTTESLTQSLRDATMQEYEMDTF